MSNVTVPTKIVKDETERKNGRPFFNQISRYYSEFMNNSTIHGLKYMVGSDKSFIEKIWWICILSVSVYFCAVLIKLTWQKWEENPVVIGLSQKSVPLWKIPFPAVTVCYGNSDKRLSIFSFLSPRFQEPPEPCFPTNLESEFEQENGSEILEKSAFSVDDIFSKCSIVKSGFTYNEICSRKFSPVINEMGLCFSYNTLDKKYIFNNITHLPRTDLQQQKIKFWTFDDNYRKNVQDVYPVRSVTTESYMFFSLKRPLKKLSCENAKLTVILHHPAEIPTLVKRPIYIEKRGSYDIGVKPEMTFTSNDLKLYAPRRRKCFYSYERQLHFFKIYSEELCKIECLANYTVHFCGCVPSYMPHHWLEYESGFLNKHPGVKLCECLPSCTSIIYRADVIQAVDSEGSNDDTVNIRFRQSEFMAMERQELFGDVNFWASCGGLLGLFTGFSVMSLVEIVYYLTLRWIIVLGKKILQRCNF
ncbi:pickpocket protein 28-like [Zophobas morio]|uniref:pickpocket protein 28-like n=1 Tax=Zophobas morio TaxID=2755281 RepID=UPI003083B3F1